MRISVYKSSGKCAFFLSGKSDICSISKKELGQKEIKSTNGFVIENHWIFRTLVLLFLFLLFLLFCVQIFKPYELWGLRTRRIELTQYRSFLFLVS